jgi:hypothetical protein
MTGSRGQFDARHDDERDPTGSKGDDDPPGPRGPLEGLGEWASFHRVESLLAVFLVVGGVVVPFVFGLGGLLFAPSTTVPQVAQTVFWASLLVAMPLLALVLVVHAVVDAYRVGIADGEITSWGRVVVRGLQTASAVVFALGVNVLLQDTAPANAEFDPAALVSAFLLLVGFAGMLAFVLGDGIVRLARGNW